MTVEDSGTQKNSGEDGLVVDEQSVIEVTKNQIDVKPIKELPGNAHIFHGQYLPYACFYAVMMSICGAAVTTTPWALIPIFACVASIIFMVAAWSVLGPGSYLKRMLVAHLIGAIPAVGLAIPFIVTLISERYYSGEFVVSLGLGVIPLSVGAQLTFWFFRGVLGWQLVPKGKSREVAYNIRDIFIVTFLCAGCLGAAQLSVFMTLNSRNYVARDTVPDLGEDGTISYDSSGAVKMRSMSEEEIQVTQAQLNASMRRSFFISYGVTFLVAAFITVVSLPVLTRLFFSEDVQTGCGFASLYLFVVALVPIGIVIGIGSFFGGAPPIDVVVATAFWFLVSVFGYGMAVWLPLLSSREIGVQLVTNRRAKLTEKVATEH